MTERKVAPNKKKKQSKRDRMKEVARNNWKPFAVGAGTVVAVIVLKRVIFPNQTAVLIKKLVIKDSILIFGTYARKQGSPSYLVKCVRTGEMWNSQTDMAKSLGVSRSLVSEYFNGHRNHIKGDIFERVAIVTPRSG